MGQSNQRLETCLQRNARRLPRGQRLERHSTDAHEIDRGVQQRVARQPAAPLVATPSFPRRGNVHWGPVVPGGCDAGVGSSALGGRPRGSTRWGRRGVDAAVWSIGVPRGGQRTTGSSSRRGKSCAAQRRRLRASNSFRERWSRPSVVALQGVPVRDLTRRLCDAVTVTGHCKKRRPQLQPTRPTLPRKC